MPKQFLAISLQGLYQVIYAGAYLLPSRTQRERKLRAHHLAFTLQDKLKKSGPLTIGLGINALIVLILTFVVVVGELAPEKNMEATFELLTPTTEMPQDVGPSALEQATSGSSNALLAPAPPAPPDLLSAVTTTAATPLQFTVAAPTVQAPTLPAFKPGAAKIAGNGNGAGQGTGFGIGNGNGAGKTGNGGGGKIGGMQVNAKNLGILLDESGSMKPHLSKVRAEIRESFKDATSQEIPGCSVLFYPDIENPNPNPTTVVIGIAALLHKNEKIDAIYWFSDLQDPITAEGLTQLQDLLLQKGVKLYVRSVSLKPQSIIDLTEITGGDFELRH